MRYKKSSYKNGLASVIVTSYNHEDFIEECILSICNQTYNNLEIIVCDDASTDRTQDLIIKLAENDSRIIPILSKSNTGLSRNFNRGLEVVSGEYFNLIGGDDLMLPTKIEKQVAFLQNNIDYDVTLHWVEVFESRTGKIIRLISNDIMKDPTDWLFKKAWFGRFFRPTSSFPPTAYLARSQYALNSYYDERLPYKNEVLFALDNYALKPNAKWHTIPEVLGKYRIHENNMSASINMKKNILEETYLVYAIGVARYPWLINELKGIVRFYLFAELAYYSKHISNIKACERRMLCECGLFIYLYYKLIKYKTMFMEKLNNRS